MQRGKQKDQMKQANYWTEGEEPGCRRGSNNTVPWKSIRTEKWGSRWAKAHKGPDRPQCRVWLTGLACFYALRVDSTIVLQVWKKAPCRQNSISALFLAQTEKQLKKGGIFVYVECVTGRFHHETNKLVSSPGRLEKNETDLLCDH